jgi:hypothetical protein
MRAAGDNKIDVAPLYLNSGLSGSAAVELAQQLYVVLNSRLPVRVNVLSDSPRGLAGQSAQARSGRRRHHQHL